VSGAGQISDGTPVAELDIVLGGHFEQVCE